MAVPPIASPAPDFTLPAFVDGKRTELTLSAQRGQPVVLAFYPGDDTPVCTRQMCSYQSDLSMLTDLGAQVWGISGQDLDSHERFAGKHGLRFPLLSDTSGDVVAAYGVKGLNRLGIGTFFSTKRAVFVVDADGLVRWSHVPTLGLTFQDATAIAAVVRELPATR